MGKIRNTYDMINDIAGEIASDGWWEMDDLISDKKEETKHTIVEAIHAFLEDNEIDPEDWEDIHGESIEDFADDTIYNEWDY